MADRTFPGDPNPPAKAPRSAPSSATPPGETGGGATALAEPPAVSDTAPPEDGKLNYRVVGDVDGALDVYAWSDKVRSTPVGRVNIGDAAEVLRASGAYFDEEMKTWEGVPEATAQALLKGRPGFTDEMVARFRAGEAGQARSFLGQQFLFGGLKPEDAQARGQVELLKAQVASRPDLTWGGLGKLAADTLNVLKHPADTLRFAVMEAAEQAPVMEKALEAAARGAAKGMAAGAAASALGSLTGPVAPAAIITGAAGVGAAYEAWKFFADTEAGSTAMDMLDKGFDPKTVQTWAPVAGVIKGTLETASFSVMTAPLKRGFIAGVLNSPGVKSALSKWYVTYASTVGAEVATELAQTRVDQVVNNFAATLEQRPDLALSPEKINDELWNTFVKTLGAASVMGGVDVAVEGAGGAMQTAREKKVATEMLATLEKDRGEGTPPAGAQPRVVETLPPPEQPAPEAAPAAETAPPEVQTFDEMLQGFEDETPESAAKVIAAAEAALEETQEEPTPGRRPTVPTAEKVQEIERKGALAERQARLEGVQARINSMERSLKEAIAKHGPTGVLVQELRDAMVEKTALKQDIEFYSGPFPEPVTKGEDLQVKPATLESVMQLGFKEGKKEAKARAQQILDIAKANKLTQADLRRLLKNKTPGAMGDVGFRNFMEGYDRTDEETGAVTHVPGFKERVQRTVERKRSLAGLRVAIKEKAVKNERNLRRLYKLPKLSEMTVEQITEYTDIINDLEKGDIILSPARIEALRDVKGPLKGARTMREVLHWASEKLEGTPLESLKIKLKEWHFWLPASHFKEPGLKILANMARASGVTAEQMNETFNEVHMELAAKALASRRALRSPLENLKAWLVPQQKDIMTYVESDVSDTLTELTGGMTPEEIEYAEFLRQFYHGAYAWLRLNSRFEDQYVPHIARPLSEIVKDIKGLPDVKKAFTELLERFHGAQEGMTVFDRNGKELGLQKFFQHALRRSGKLTPTANIFDSTRIYAKRFHTKVALDEFIPVAKTMAEVVTMGVRDKDAAATLARDFETFTNEYVNAKKGNAKWAWIKGEEMESVIRFGMTMAALQHIAFSVKIQGAAWVGETVSEFMALGAKKMALAKVRKRTAQGKAILEKYSGNIGETPWAQFIAPGTTFEAKLGLLAYGLFKFNRIRTMEDLVLGNMTEAEFAAGEISDERLAAIETAAGRWIDVHGLKSIRGSSVAGAGIEQFKSWAIPPMLTIAEDAMALSRSLRGKGPLTEQQFDEMHRIATVAAVAMLASVAASRAKDDEGLLPDLIRNMIRELWTTFQAFTTIPGIVRGTAPWAGWYMDLGVLLRMMVPVSKDEDGNVVFEQPTNQRTGEKKWRDAAGRMLPIGTRQFRNKDMADR